MFVSLSYLIVRIFVLYDSMFYRNGSQIWNSNIIAYTCDMSEWLSLTTFLDSGQQGPYNPYKHWHNLNIIMIITHVIWKI